jgi:hypothetical protein
MLFYRRFCGCERPSVSVQSSPQELNMYVQVRSSNSVGYGDAPRLKFFRPSSRRRPRLGQTRIFAKNGGGVYAAGK